VIGFSLMLIYLFVNQKFQKKDDDVLYDIFEFHAPPLRKLPVALWVRIKDDLKGYMVEKEINDTRVIYWYFVLYFYSFFETNFNHTGKFSV
jgi:hypothetical protein